MQLPLQVTFRNMEPSAAVEAEVRDRAEQLDTLFDRITSCRVAVEAPHRHHHKGNLFHVRIDITVPGRELVVGRSPAAHHAHEDVYVAIRDAFRAAARQLEDHARLVRGEVKTHAVPAQGRVARLFADQGYGFIETCDGDEIYFHRNSVVEHAFDRLDVGSEVRVVTTEGETGTQAKTVKLIGKHHPA
jgi:cold shock CspA family protein/ribosome-associated translation inhibitor RaiA